ncbi:MAG: hypothetical protein ACOZAO_01785 [Patescibacteria group bacterium]
MSGLVLLFTTLLGVAIGYKVFVLEPTYTDAGLFIRGKITLALLVAMGVACFISIYITSVLLGSIIIWVLENYKTLTQISPLLNKRGMSFVTSKSYHVSYALLIKPNDTAGTLVVVLTNTPDKWPATVVDAVVWAENSTYSDANVEVPGESIYQVGKYDLIRMMHKRF